MYVYKFFSQPIFWKISKKMVEFVSLNGFITTVQFLEIGPGHECSINQKRQ